MPHLMQKTQRMENNLGSDFQEKFNDLHEEIGRLSRELDRAISENIQSAKCGLALLEEKCNYQNKCAELETVYEYTRQELEAAQKALKKLAVSQKTTTENGIEHETALLNESAAMESSFTFQVQELETEVKQLRRELQRVTEERDHYSQDIAEITENKLKLEAEKVQLKQILRELKLSEAKTAANNTELEEENYVLQRELLRLQTIQTEFKTSKSEINRLLEENLHLHEQIEELQLQKQITETRLDETAEALEVEREANKTLRKEVEVYGCKGLLLKTRSLADSISEIKDIGDSDGSLFATSISSRTESTNSSDGYAELLPQVFNELKQLRQQLEDLENLERSSLKTGELLCGLGGDQSEHQFLQTELNTLTAAAGVEATKRLEEQMETGDGGFLEEIKEHKETLNGKVRSSHADLDGLQRSSVAETMHVLNNELLSLREKVRALAANTSWSTFNYISETAGENLEVTQNTLVTLNEELLRFGAEIYAVDGQSSTCNLFGDEGASPAPRSSPGLELLAKSSNLKNQAVLALGRFNVVWAAVHRRQMGSMKNGFSTNPNNLAEAKLLKRVDKLEKLLSKKQNDIATLQAIIKSNKTTAKEILANIRRKYDEEKEVVNETILKLSRELKALKDETAALHGLREKFMSRCTKYFSSFGGLPFELEAAEEEKKLLRKILKISINRKVDLQRRLRAMRENLRGIKSDIPENRKKSVQFSNNTIFYE